MGLQWTFRSAEDFHSCLPICQSFLPQVSELDAGNSDIGDTEMQHVAAMTNLEVLRLSAAQVTDAGLVHVRGLTKLRMLALRDCVGVTDQGLKELADLKELTILRLKGTSVSDAGLAELTGLTKLQILNLDQTQVTPAGAASLKEQLPSLFRITVGENE